MNKHLENAYYEICKADSLMYAYENTYLDADYSENNERDLRNRAGYLFYAIWDNIRAVKESLNLIEKESKK